MEPYGEVYHDPSGRNYLEHLNPSGWDHMERCKSALQDRTIWSNVPEPFRMETHRATYRTFLGAPKCSIVSEPVMHQFQVLK